MDAVTKIPKPIVHYVREYKLDALSVSRSTVMCEGCDSRVDFNKGILMGAAGKSSFAKHHFECYDCIAAMSPLQRLKHGW